MSAEPLLEVRGLTTRFRTDEGTIHAVEDVSFAVSHGQRFGLVGESGCGKTVTALSIMGLIDPPGRIEAGEVRFGGRDLRSLGERDYRQIRGGEIALALQDPLAALNPVMRLGDQLIETILTHRDCRREEARSRTIELLNEVGIPRAEQRLGDYPHQFSGGMRQRVGLALALSCDPALVIADEPTTALDVTIQAQILELLAQLSRDRGMAVILITHDLAVIAGFVEEVAVMYAGRIVERAGRRELFYRPAHPYTRDLLRSVSRLDRPPARRLPTIPGAPPNLLAPPPGCPYHPRCSLSGGRAQCRTDVPQLRQPRRPGPARAADGERHTTACHFAEELPADAPPQRTS